MKLTDLIENDEWENTSSSKQSEIAFLQKKRIALTHHRAIGYHKMNALIKKGIIVRTDQADPNTLMPGVKFVRVPGTGGKETSYHVYVAPEGQPDVARVVGELTKIETLDKQVISKMKHVMFHGNRVCFTGFRDAAMERIITSLGGTVVPGVSKKLDILIADNPLDSSGKMLKAKEYGIRIISRREASDILGA